MTTTYDRDAFDELLGPHRRELLAHCYRMLGSVHDADDALQDTMLRAWRGLPGFAGRSSLRTWLYRIATNACLALIERNGRQPVPGDDLTWLEPFPYEIDDDPAAPAAVIERRESMELAFVTAFQQLPAKERAVLVLRDVLGFSASEAATVLDTSVAAVTSRLQRGRRRLRGRLPDVSQRTTLRALGDDQLQAVVTAYVDAWEQGDADAIVALVTEDATFEMPPDPSTFHGPASISAFLADAPFRVPWRLVPVRVAGQLAFGCYTRDTDGSGAWVAHSVDVVTLRADRIARITAFNDARLVRLLGLPDRLDPR